MEDEPNLVNGRRHSYAANTRAQHADHVHIEAQARRRAFWVEDDLWLTAVAVAKARGESLSEVLREALRRYVKGAR